MRIKDTIRYIISIILIYIIFDNYGYKILQIINIIDYKYIILIIGISFGQHLLSAYRWMYVSKFTNLNINFKNSLKYYYIAGFMNNILPGGIPGDLYRIYCTSDNKKEIFKMGKSFQSVIFERLSGQIMLFFVFIASLTIYFLTNQKYIAFLYLILPTALIFFLIKYLIKYNIKKYFGTKDITKNFHMLFTGPIFWNHIILSFFVVASYILIYIISAISLGLEIDYLAFLVFTPIILFSMTLPVSIGGWGVREVTALLVSFLIGLSASASISVSIIYGILNLICSLPGLFLFLNLRNR
ncbi:MAG: hypothetical protein CMD84_05175 [Gammaproteobacteria bacterium]|nr:hypothetical protein [Gammaproteobacteria bacterium]|tara:strand:+ start:7661 stop:8554 length:894 start_codon:yes stop_codon:yes gene_type:complete